MIMRLWSLHPRHLDSKGLVALWREALLAQAVLAGRTMGYRHHPQLERFRAAPLPRRAIRRYLEEVLEEALRRGYSFDPARILPATDDTAPRPPVVSLEVSEGQLAYEGELLRGKLRRRDPRVLKELESGPIEVHPLFTVVTGGIASWERPKNPG